MSVSARDRAAVPINLSVQRVVKKLGFHSEAAEADQQFYRRVTGEQRLEILLDLIASNGTDETAGGFKRVYRVVKQPRR